MKHLRKISFVSIVEFSTEFVVIWLGIKLTIDLIRML